MERQISLAVKKAKDRKQVLSTIRSNFTLDRTMQRVSPIGTAEPVLVLPVRTEQTRFCDSTKDNIILYDLDLATIDYI